MFARDSHLDRRNCLLSVSNDGGASVTNSYFNSFNFRSVKCIFCGVNYVLNRHSFLSIIIETARVTREDETTITNHFLKMVDFSF